jgi:hypothetical protein
MIEEDSVTICILLYGQYYDLHKRLLDGLVRSVPAKTTVSLWLNQVSQPSFDMITRLPSNFKIFRVSADNTPKYIAMREMVAPLKADPNCKFMTWFDDDSQIVADDWFPKLLQYIESKREENVCYIGQPYWVFHLPGQTEFMAKAPWYKNIPWEIIRGKPAITFAQGSFFVLRTDVLRQLDWPDPRLQHNGGDAMLACAVQQQGLPFHKYYYGIKPNAAPRRGLNQVPAGCTDQNARR